MLNFQRVVTEVVVVTEEEGDVVVVSIVEEEVVVVVSIEEEEVVIEIMVLVVGEVEAVGEEETDLVVIVLSLTVAQNLVAVIVLRTDLMTHTAAHHRVAVIHMIDLMTPMRDIPHVVIPEMIHTPATPLHARIPMPVVHVKILMSDLHQTIMHVDLAVLVLEIRVMRHVDVTHQPVVIADHLPVVIHMTTLEIHMALHPLGVVGVLILMVHHVVAPIHMPHLEEVPILIPHPVVPPIHMLHEPIHTHLVELILMPILGEPTHTQHQLVKTRMPQEEVTAATQVVDEEDMDNPNLMVMVRMVRLPLGGMAVVVEVVKVNLPQEVEGMDMGPHSQLAAHSSFRQ